MTLKTFDEILVSNAAIHLGMFGVKGTYQPGILSRSIQVIIRYVEDAGPVIPGARQRSPVVKVKAANDSMIGIAAEEFIQGQVISIPPRKGAEAREFNLTRIVKQNAGMVTYEVH